MFFVHIKAFSAKIDLTRIWESDTDINQLGPNQLLPNLGKA
jgi:hypothetical protein